MSMGFQYFYKAKGMIFLHGTVVHGYQFITIFSFFIEIRPLDILLNAYRKKFKNEYNKIYFVQINKILAI